MTWLEWCYYSSGLHKSKIKEWEHTRAITWMIYKSNSDPKKSAKIMSTWMPLSTDKNYVAKSKRQKGKRLNELKKKEFFKSMR